ncbi:hypothetical protein [Ornithinibacillus halophilus]|uniref:Uncharacterized protein n=1 Tax=Ornithinibacillus halophilus TaxID=930117 RepID=A0A1M5P6I2_9BACI|nr:hypothetical protein [Ornithinibacillus halophilus]SHG97424.1 hypothetical protein SAMN05216225_11072 [Ornithinibacillus halophilus]
MSQPLKTTSYCNLLARGTVQSGEEIYAIEKIYIHDLQQEEIRFAWYKEQDGKIRFVPRPLDLPEKDLFHLIAHGFESGVFSDEFRENLKRIV